MAVAGATNRVARLPSRARVSSHSFVSEVNSPLEAGLSRSASEQAHKPHFSRELKEGALSALLLES